MTKEDITAFIRECCTGCDYEPKIGSKFCPMHHKRITQKLLMTCENAI